MRNVILILVTSGLFTSCQVNREESRSLSDNIEKTNVLQEGVYAGKKGDGKSCRINIEKATGSNNNILFIGKVFGLSNGYFTSIFKKGYKIKEGYNEGVYISVFSEGEKHIEVNLRSKPLEVDRLNENRAEPKSFYLYDGNETNKCSDLKKL